MAVKLIRRISFSVITIIIIGTVIIFLGRSRDLDIPADDISKFINVYTELSISKETLNFSQDSTLTEYKSIYENAGVDSLWLAQFVENLSKYPELQKNIWTQIVARLDSLRENAPPDTIKIL